MNNQNKNTRKLSSVCKYILLYVIIIFSPRLLAQSNSEDWIVEMGGPLTDQANAMYIDARQNVYITGFFQGEVSVGDKKYKANGDTDIFLAKINKEGSIEWFDQAGSNITRANIATEMGNSIILDEAGNVIVCGIFSGRAAFGDTVIMSNGSDDIFLAKYSNDGNLLWVKGFGNIGCNIGQCLAFDGSNIYLTGKSSGSCFNPNINQNGSLAFLASFDKDGNLSWLQEELASPMVLNTSLCLDHDYIYWGSSIIMRSELDNDKDLNKCHFVFIKKVYKDGSDLSAKTLRINEFQDHFKFLSYKDSIFICDNISGITRNISSLLNESLKSDESSLKNNIVQELYSKEIRNSNSYRDDTIKEKVILTNSTLSPNGQFLNYFSIDNCIIINQNQEVALQIDGNSHTYIPYIADFKLVSAINENDQNIYLLANYSGNILVNESEYLFSKNRNILLMKGSLKNLGSGSDHEFGADEHDIIEVYPNPSKSGVFNIECGNQKIKVKSIIIKDCIDQDVNSNFDGYLPAFIDISSKTSGIYFLLIEFENNTTIKKLILAK